MFLSKCLDKDLTSAGYVKAGIFVADFVGKTDKMRIKHIGKTDKMHIKHVGKTDKAMLNRHIDRADTSVSVFCLLHSIFALPPSVQSV